MSRKTAPHTEDLADRAAVTAHPEHADAIKALIAHGQKPGKIIQVLGAGDPAAELVAGERRDTILFLDKSSGQPRTFCFMAGADEAICWEGWCSHDEHVARSAE